MRRRSLAAGVLLLALALPRAAPAGAWLREAGEYYFKMSGAYLFTREEFDADGGKMPISGSDLGVQNGTFEDIGVNGYLEYGVNDRLTLVASIPFKHVTTAWSEFNETFDARRDIEARSGGFADLRAGLRYPLKTRGFPVAVEGRVKLPLGYDPTPDMDQVPPLGSGKLDFDLSLLVGASLWPFPGYVGASAGYRARGGLANEVLFNVEGGVTWGRLFAKTALDGVYSTGDKKDLGQSSVAIVNNEDVLKLVAEVSYRFTAKVAVSAETFHVLAGANTIAGTSWSAGLVLTN